MVAKQVLGLDHAHRVLQQANELLPILSGERALDLLEEVGVGLLGEGLGEQALKGILDRQAQQAEFHGFEATQ